MKNWKLSPAWLTTLAVSIMLSTCLAVPLGANVQGVRYDPNTNIAWISIVNNSKKFITGYVLSIDVIHADGKKDHSQFTEDFPGRGAEKQGELGSAWNGEGTVRPGEVREQRYDVTSTPANPILRVDATVAVVAYSDGTADAQDAKAFEYLRSVRQGQYLAYLKAAQVARKALANGDDPEPLQSALKELQRLRDNCSTRHTGESCSDLAASVSDLGQYSTEMNGTARDFLDGFAKRYEHWAAQAAPHSQLWRQK